MNCYHLFSAPRLQVVLISENTQEDRLCITINRFLNFQFVRIVMHMSTLAVANV